MTFKYLFITKKKLNKKFLMQLEFNLRLLQNLKNLNLNTKFTKTTIKIRSYFYTKKKSVLLFFFNLCDVIKLQKETSI